MFEIPVYNIEREDGIEAKIRSSASIALSSIVEQSNTSDISEKALAKIKNLSLEFAKASDKDLDLHYITTVLVSTGWNKNDDVFDTVETWVARKTPEDKPLNYEHDCAKIVGHMTSNWAMDEEGKVIADDSVIEQVPEQFHIVTGAVVYKYWSDPELQNRMDTLLAEIAQGKWFVSMECLFKGFDYALKGKDGISRVVARNEKTAFLSKYLKAYGGKGYYNDHRVGRIMRNIIFSGKGFTKDPANPKSVILKSEVETFSSAQAQYSTDFSQEKEEQVYVNSVEQINQERKLIMTATVETLQAEVETLKAQVAGNESVKTDLDAALSAKANAETLLKDATEKVASVEEEVKTKDAEVETLKTTLAETNKKLEEAQEELKSLYAEKTKAKRVEVVQEKLGIEKEKAVSFVTTTETLSDDSFNAQLDVLVAMTAWTTNNPKDGNTNFAAPAAKSAPKATPAPHGPKATSKPAPMSAKAESDDAGEDAADAADLENAQANNSDATLSTSITDSGVNDVQKSIAVALGYKTAE